MSRIIHTDEVRHSGLVTREHSFELPLVHGDPADPRRITVFAREVTPVGTEHEDRPMLVWLQGGPGMPADRPTGPGGWMERALSEYRVLLLDQRGTGRSSALTARTLPGVEEGRPEVTAEYLGHFRAPDIVADAEAIRALLIGERTWTILGQSFGGFCALSYLSLAPEGLAAALITGGLADLTGDARSVYEATFEKTRIRNADYFATYPSDRARLTAIHRHLSAGTETLPTGEVLTPERVLGLGTLLGSSTGFHALHYLLENAFVPRLEGETGPERLTDAFLDGAGSVLSFRSAPLYALLHESIYGAGAATAWAAQRVRDTLPDFAPDAAEPLLSGEMIYPWLFAQDPALAPVAEAADLLARREDWAPLYDLDALARNTVPAAAIVYHADMYVPFESSMRTARAVRGLEAIVTSEMHHNGIRVDGAGLLDKLLRAVRR